ncbi:MAG TPA: hypothetical protein VGP82_12050 [Ktedonobacterales bacterium]|jgi:hypothetical protein|nr:hypothetical protein [Ktedonobacterales bacterium]
MGGFADWASGRCWPVPPRHRLNARPVARPLAVPPLAVLARLGAPLFLLLGLPAIQATQPATRRAGQVGLGLMGLAAATALLVALRSLTGGADFAPAVPFASALARMVGDVLVGALTVRARIFPAWVGWLLAVSGLINLGKGLLSGARPHRAGRAGRGAGGRGDRRMRLDDRPYGGAEGGIHRGQPLRS